MFTVLEAWGRASWVRTAGIIGLWFLGSLSCRKAKVEDACVGVGVGVDVGDEAGVVVDALPPQFESKKLANRAEPRRKMIRDNVFKGPFWTRAKSRRLPG
jgi:hypothetical protein